MTLLLVRKIYCHLGSSILIPEKCLECDMHFMAFHGMMSCF